MIFTLLFKIFSFDSSFSNTEIRILLHFCALSKHSKQSSNHITRPSRSICTYLPFFVTPVPIRSSISLVQNTFFLAAISISSQISFAAAAAAACTTH